MQRDAIIRLIGALKLAKSITLVALGLGAFALINHAMPERVRTYIDGNNAHVRSLFYRLDGKKLVELGLGSFAYAMLFLIEGVGLLARRVWAEYVTIAITTSFVPFEVYELVHALSAMKLAVLVVNVLIVIYLVARRWRARRGARSGTAPLLPRTPVPHPT